MQVYEGKQYLIKANFHNPAKFIDKRPFPTYFIMFKVLMLEIFPKNAIFKNFSSRGGAAKLLSATYLISIQRCYLAYKGFQKYPYFLICRQLGFIAHDRSKEFHWKFNPPVAAKMIQLQNPLLRFLKTTKGNFSGEDF